MAIQTTDFNHFDSIGYQRVEVPVMPKQGLIRYKRILNREVDRQDIVEIVA